MKTNPLPKTGSLPSGKPVAAQQKTLTVNDSDGVCKECLNEEIDSCVCPNPEK